MDTNATELFDSKNIQQFTSLVIKHCNDQSILEKIQPSSVQEVLSVLSEKLLEAGYECCSSPESVRKLLSGINCTEKDVAIALGCMARSYTNMSGVGDGSAMAESNWNVENFVNVVIDVHPELDWNKVIEDLDYAHFFIYDAKGLDILVRAWKHCPKRSDPFPVNSFFGKWRNLKGQLSALYQMVNAPTDALNLVTCSKRKIIQEDDFASSGAQIQMQAAQLYESQLNSLDLMECVLDLSNTIVADDAKVFVDMMVNKTPELVFLGFLQAQSTNNVGFQKDILGRLLIMYLKGTPSSPLVLTKLWQVNSDFFIKSILELYGNDGTSLSRILDIVHELKLLPVILNIQPLFFALDLAALAARREFLNLEKWLQDKIIEHKDLFIRVCLEFLSQKLAAEAARVEDNATPTTMPLSMEVIGVFLKVLSESPMVPDNAELLKEVQKTCIHTYPKLLDTSRAPDVGGPSGSTEVSFKPDVEEEANAYYERIYSGEISVDDMIERLKMFSQSKNPREQDVFACMIHNLFDEYHFFPKYPDKELSITSVFFGLLVQNHLVSYVSLGVALRCVLDALRNPIGSKMFNFGLQALMQFQGRLAEWPQFCASLLQITQLQQANPDLARFIAASLQTAQVQQPNDAIASSDLPNQATQQQQQPQQQRQMDAGNAERVPVFTAIHVPDVPKSVDGITYETPAEDTQDKILFIINNIARNNMQDKSSELVKILDASSYKWFSNYLVVKRVSLEPNYHDLYLLLIDSLNSTLLYQHVLRETYANIQVLLNSEKTVSSSSERSLLKNLGSWLGGMTLARNKPIRHKHIALKDLLLEGYDNNRLIVVIPFVCKVLEQCNKSIVFKPPNPWLMATLKLLVELYHSADLKLNLKFEIEVLCNGLSIVLESIDATSILKDHEARSAAKNALMDGLGRATSASMEAIGRSPASAVIPPASVMDGATMDDANMAIPNIAQYIVFNPQIILYSSQPTSKRWVVQAITQSIREIIEPVVERSVAIASVSTRELITKDFAVESDENQMRNAAHMMAQSLAGSLAMVTCKEPLRLSMATNLRAIFVANGLPDAMAEQAVLVTVSDNLDLVCAVIEKVAMSKVAAEIDELLINSYANRKKHREQRPGQPFFDMDVFSMSRYPLSLPEPLRAKPNGMHSAQLRVYEDFRRIPRSAPQTESDLTPMSHPSDAYTQAYNMPGANVFAGGAAAVNAASAGAGASNGGYDNMLGQHSAHQVLERFNQYLVELETLVNQTNAPNFASLPPLHDIRVIIRQVPTLASSSFDKVEAARAFAQKVVSRLYKSETQLSREVYVVLLERLCVVSPNVGTLVTYWLTHVDDERKYNVPVTVALIKAGLINVMEQDQELGHLIESGRPTAIDFAAQLVNSCIFDENLVTPQDFAISLEAISRLRGSIPDSVLMLMDNLRGNIRGQGRDTQEGGDAGLREQLRYFFAEWVQLCQHPSTNEKAQGVFLLQLSQHTIFQTDDMSSLFFRVCIEAAIERALRFKQIPGQAPGAAYQLIDAFSKLVVGLVKVQSDNLSAAARVNLFSKVLSVTVLILSQHHERDGDQFNQRPFLRLFTCLLSDLHAAEQQLLPVYFGILTALSNTFYTLQPSSFPGFSFAWLQLISHRLFMPKLLLSENQKGWPTFQRLVISLFQFLVPFLRDAELRDTTRMLYRGTLRILLVLLHDFPEFLSDYHLSFCDVIPASCIQLRNLILSAFPRNMRLPDPFTPNLKVDLLPEINQAPRILSDYVGPLTANDMKQDIDDFLESRIPKERLVDLVRKFTVDPMAVIDSPSSATTQYNIPLVNALVFYVGVSGILQGIPVNQGAPIEIYQQLLMELDSKGCYVFLSAIANQLRYPNSHTHYFSCVLLYLFAESDNEMIKEQITRVLLERLIVNRPHPWGLLITFIELIKNPRYNFWNHSFTRCATDIERLFESVSRSINQI
ncbi:Not1-domain-containing protein [Lichtheimia hyalospora FSU 10163]|nr:Not1-domain-containing protein [Lichtheimia hyalospora FSU 10163]